jgi:hypothetical protein
MIWLRNDDTNFGSINQTTCRRRNSRFDQRTKFFWNTFFIFEVFFGEFTHDYSEQVNFAVSNAIFSGLQFTLRNADSEFLIIKRSRIEEPAVACCHLVNLYSGRCCSRNFRVRQIGYLERDSLQSGKFFGRDACLSPSFERGLNSQDQLCL